MRRNLLLLGVLWMVLSTILTTVELGREPEMVIRWATESEVDTLGFNLYRAAKPDGPFQQINPFLIPSSTDPLAGAEYEYIDSAVEARQRYFYRLEEIEADGTSNHVELASGRALGLRPWMLLLSSCGAIFGGLLFVAGLRTSGQQGVQISVVGSRRPERRGENHG
jgi:hypothetical protein